MVVLLRFAGGVDKKTGEQSSGAQEINGREIMRENHKKQMGETIVNLRLFYGACQVTNR